MSAQNDGPAWEDWAERYGVLFGLTTPADGLMLVEWGRIFEHAGFTPQDLIDAGDWLAANDPPRFRREHLRALQDRLRSVRRQKAAEATIPPEIASQGPACTLCGGCGIVCGIPNPESEEKGRYSEMSAWCRCPLGLWMRGRDKRNMQTIEQVEHYLPDWRERIDRRREQLSREARADQAAHAADRTYGPVLFREKIKARRGVGDGPKGMD